MISAIFTQRPGVWRALLAIVMCGALPPALGLTAIATPVTINNNAATDVNRDDAVQVACGANGVWVAVWVTPGAQPVDSTGNDPAYAGSLNEDIVFARSTNGGRTWSAPTPLKPNPTSDRGDDIAPCVATDGQGRWMIVWQSWDSMSGTKGYDADIVMSVSSDNGQTWSAATPVNSDAASDPGGWSINTTPGCYDFSPQVCTDGQGRWIVAWTRCDNRSGSWKVSAAVAVSQNSGATWTAPYLVQTRTDLGSIYIIEGVAVATDRQGRWIMTWSSRPDTYSDYDLYYSISSNNGATWSAATMLNANGGADKGHDMVNRLATDGLGRWVAVWQSDDPLGGTVGTDTDLFYATSFDSGATWSAPTALNSDAATDGAGKDLGPCVIYDGTAGKWVVAWTTDKLGGDYDILYATCPAGSTAWTAAKPLNPWAATDAWVDRGASLASNAQETWMSAWWTDYNMGGAKPGSDVDLLCFPAGTSYGPRLVSSAASFGFQQGSAYEVNVELNGQPTEQSLTLTNEGTEAVQVSAVRFSGPHASDYSLAPVPTTPLTLTMGGSSAFKVCFAPTEKTRTMNMNATLEVLSNDPAQPTMSMPLVGDAVPVELGGFSAE